MPVTIDKPSKYFTAKTYTGTGSSQSVSLDFSPDWVWIKARSGGSFSGARGHALFDSVRGVTNRLETNTTGAEQTDSTLFTSFDSAGFTVGTSGTTNESGQNMVAWSWRGSDSSAVSNTSGTITSTVSANTTSGFSIVSYTGNGTSGATVGHGLGAKPAMIIFKNRIDSASAKWAVYHQAAFVSQADPNILYLDDTAAAADDVNVLGNTTVTLNSTLFSLGNYNGTNGSGDGIIAYCFAEVKGFSKAFSYTGNGSSDGVFVNLGFKPAFIMIKASSTTGNWFMQDITRNNNFNGDPKTLQANVSSSESTIGTWGIDLLSNGFKVRESNVGVNGSGSTYIGIAFASNPFVSSKGIPTCAV